MATSSSPALFKLRRTDDFCSAAENSIKNCITKGQPCPSSPEGPVTEAGLRKDDGSFCHNRHHVP